MCGCLGNSMCLYVVNACWFVCVCACVDSCDFILWRRCVWQSNDGQTKRLTIISYTREKTHRELCSQQVLWVCLCTKRPTDNTNILEQSNIQTHTHTATLIQSGSGLMWTKKRQHHLRDEIMLEQTVGFFLAVFLLCFICEILTFKVSIFSLFVCFSFNYTQWWPNLTAN